MKNFTRRHARAGLDTRLPKLEGLPNQFKGYRITITIPEYTSLCPRTLLPDYGTVTIEYEPAKFFVELKSLKYYILSYRNLGIFYENAINRILKDLVKAIKPRWLVVRGEFTVRGGMRSVVEAHYPVRGKPPGKRD
jgi:7-cyano-7-deazaguanine reductase